METKDKKNENAASGKKNDPQQQLRQNPALRSEELEKNVSHGDKNDFINEDPDEERREIEKTSEDNLNSAE